jgi:hypothetical protein
MTLAMKEIIASSICVVEPEQFARRAYEKVSFYYTNFYIKIDSKNVHLTQLRRFPKGDFQTEYPYYQVKAMLDTFTKSNGMYAYYQGPLDPFDLLEDMKENSDKFSEHDLVITELEGAFEVSGQQQKLSNDPTGFRYRFFCREKLNEWIAKAKMIDSSPSYKYTLDHYVYS